MSHDGMEGLNDFHPPQGQAPSPWETQQQLRLAALEDTMRVMSQTLERLALLTVPTPSTTPLPTQPLPPPAPHPLPPTRSAKVSPPDMYSGD